MQTTAVVLLEYRHQGNRGGSRTMDFVLVLFFSLSLHLSLLMCFCNLPFAKGFGISAPSTPKEQPLSGISPLLTQLPERHGPRRVGFFWGRSRK